MEPDWEEIKARLMALPMRLIRPLGKRWFNGSLGGASAKDEYVQNMVGNMHYWWNHCAHKGGQDRVNNVLFDLENVEMLHAVTGAKHA